MACLKRHGRVEQSSACHICCCAKGLSHIGLAHLRHVAESCLETPVDNVRPWSFLYYFLGHKNNHCLVQLQFCVYMYGLLYGIAVQKAEFI